MPHNHPHLFYWFKNKELNELYVSIAIRSFSLAVIGVFIPIYLLQEGYSLVQTLLFFSIVTGTMTLFSLPAAKIASVKGFKHLILYSIPLSILGFLGLYNLGFFSGFFYFVAFIFGISNTFFWMGFHLDFCKFSNKKKRGSEVGIARIFTFVFHAGGPLIGGFLLVLIGFNLVFLIVSGLLIFSAVPLFFSKDVHKPIPFSIKEVFKKRKLRDVLTFIGFGIERGAGYVVWPIFIFFGILGEEYLSLGSVASFAMLLSSLFIVVVGKFSDKYRRFVLRIGAISNSIVWAAKGLVRTTAHVFIVDGFYGMSQTTLNVPFDAIVYDKAKRENFMKYIVFKEMTLNFGRTMFFIAMIFISDLVFGFLFGGVGGSLLQLLF